MPTVTIIIESNNKTFYISIVGFSDESPSNKSNTVRVVEDVAIYLRHTSWTATATCPLDVADDDQPRIEIKWENIGLSFYVTNKWNKNKKVQQQVL